MNNKIWIVSIIADVGGCNPHLAFAKAYSNEQSAYEKASQIYSNRGTYELLIENEEDVYDETMEYIRTGNYRQAYENIDPQWSGVYVTETEVE